MFNPEKYPNGNFKATKTIPTCEATDKGIDNLISTLNSRMLAPDVKDHILASSVDEMMRLLPNIKRNHRGVISVLYRAFKQMQHDGAFYTEAELEAGKVEPAIFG
jgi:hypothetical protein